MEIERKKLIEMFTRAGENYLTAGKLSSAEVYPNHDVHAFFRLSDESRIIHVQGSSEMSSNIEAYLFIRVVDFREMMRIRENIDVGEDAKPNYPASDGIKLPYYHKVLEAKIAENFPELSLAACLV